MSAWKNCRVRRTRTGRDYRAALPVLGGLALLLAVTSACSAAVDNGGGAPAGPAPALPASPSVDTARTAERLQAALAQEAAREAKPGTGHIRQALAEAGFLPGAIEVTASRTPTGLEADAVEAAVRQGQDCVVGQVRGGSVTVVVLPVLADGRCLAGSPA